MGARYLLALLVTAAAAAVAVPAFAAETQVTVSSNQFSPSAVRAMPGDSVKWTNAGGFHQIVFQDNDVAMPSEPSFDEWTVSRTFTDPGEYLYYCSVHGGPNGVGMSGRVIVANPAGEPAPAEPTGPTGPADGHQLAAYTVSLKLKKSGKATRKGQLYIFSGVVSPAAAGHFAQIQIRGRGGKHRTVATAKLVGSENARSTYTKKLRIKKTAVYRVRVPKLGDVRNGLSKAVRAKVARRR